MELNCSGKQLFQLAHAPAEHVPRRVAYLNPASISQATADLQPRKHERKWWLISVMEIWSCLLFGIIVVFRKRFREITNNVC